MEKMKNILVLSFGEEVANSITHGVMAFLLVLVMPICGVISYQRGGIAFVIGNTVFLVSIFLMFLFSTLYHAMAYETKHKLVFRILDHCGIYLAIAGSYTPAALFIIGGWEGYLLLAIQWITVLIGILYKSIAQNSIPKVSLTIYLVMGWSVVFFLPNLIRNANTSFLIWLTVGGILYSIGAMFYAKKGFKYHHMVWHLFINVAALTHFVAIIFFI